MSLCVVVLEELAWETKTDDMSSTPRLKINPPQTDVCALFSFVDLWDFCFNPPCINKVTAWNRNTGSQVWNLTKPVSHSKVCWRYVEVTAARPNATPVQKRRGNCDITSRYCNTVTSSCSTDDLSISPSCLSLLFTKNIFVFLLEN